MKKLYLLLFLFFAFSISLYAEDISISTETVSISTETVAVADSTDIVEDTDQENPDQTSIPMSVNDANMDTVGTYYQSGAIIETSTKTATYDVNVPTTTASSISGTKVLEKIETGTTTVKDKPSILSSDYYAKLPLESKLLLTGRKLIGMTYNATIYDKPEAGKRSNLSSFSMDQELQMKIKGTVSDRLTLNIDYDDTYSDKKDISIVYKGYPDEFVQEAAFGDITVALPSTEFTGYSKELFGVKLDTRYKGLSTKAFFSKTKGYSESKQFKGNTKLVKLTIPDTAYIRYKYYSMVQDPNIPKSIKQGTLKVFLDRTRVQASDYIVISTNTALKSMRNPTSSFEYRGNFVQLVAGQDYTLDYNTGILMFKNVLSAQYIVAIDYQFSDGTWLSDTTGGNPQIIKDTNNTRSAEMMTTELFTYYSLGNYQITRDDGRGNFILEIKDLNNVTPTRINPGDKPVPLYPNVPNSENNIIVDFENGIFNLSPIEPKNPDNTFPLHDSLYTSGTHLYNFITEYKYKVKIFTLRSGIVPMSEKVILDGVTLKINEDYFIDYDLGILTILKESLINENSVIDVSYDYSPFGSASSGATLVGFRSQYDVNNNLSVGGSFIYEFSAKDTILPDLYNTPSSSLVGEFDTKINNIKITDTLAISAGAEYAISKFQSNTTGKAIIESMEGSKQESSLSMIYDTWFYSATPDGSRYNTNSLSWKTYDIEKKEIDPNLEIISGEKQQVMEITYNLLSRPTASIVQVVNSAGNDFSSKLYIEMWIKGDGKNTTLQLDYATSVNEDSDGMYGQVLEDGTIKTSPHTEDKDGDGLLTSWEDIGRDFYNFDTYLGVSKIGPHNGKIDTEDLNGNNILDRYELNVSSFSVNVDWTGWKKVQIPLNIVTEADQDKWRTIKVARLTLNNTSGNEGIITIGKISIIGNKWKNSKSNPLSDFETSSIGRDDPNYISLLSNPDYRDLYELSGNIVMDEQSLRLVYNSSSSDDEFYAKTTYFGNGIDISLYDNFKFFVFVASTTASSPSEIIMRAGADDNNYLQYSIPVTDNLKGQWTLITIKQEFNSVSSKWVSTDSGTITIIGNPSLKQIAYLQTGIKTNQADAGELWINEIHVTGARGKDGNAWKVTTNLRWDGTDFLGPVSLSLSRKSIDKDFQTFAPGTYNRDYLEDTASLGFKGMSINGIDVLPLNASITKLKIITPLAQQNESDKVSLLDEGTVISYNSKAETVLSAGNNVPRVTLQYARSLKDTQEIERLEDAESIYANLTYTNPIEFDMLPTNLTGDYRVVNSAFKKYPTTPITDSNSFLDLDTAKKYMDIKDFLTTEKTETWGLKTPFKFFDTVTFSPTYIFSKVNEKNKRDFDHEIMYDKSLNQDVGASLNFQVAKWFQPSVIYHINTKETYDLNYSSQTTNIIYPGQTKYIERVGTTELTWNLQVIDIVNASYLKSLSFTTSYRMQDSDAYSNVEKDFSSIGMDKLWIRNSILKEITSSTTSYIVKSVVQRDDRRVIGRYSPFESFDLRGKLMPIKTMTLNFTFTEGQEISYITGTSRDSYTRIWPDILIGMNRFENIFDISWMTDTQLNLRHNKKTVIDKFISYAESTTFGGDYRFKLLRKLDILFGANNTTSSDMDTLKQVLISEGQTFSWLLQSGINVKQWRMSLKYENSQEWSTNSTGKLASQIFTNSIVGQVNSDLMFPAGIKIPLFGIIPLKNRLIFDSNVFYKTQSSGVNIQSNNLNNFGFKVSADYEISGNFRCALIAGISRYIYTYVPDDNYTLIEFGSRLTIQF
ncbi:MAG: hypothetical protein PHR82_05985 [Endomicrobiaceae bacterium]|nr:hypothetical protein [Endomicrobiaceae bacterium]